MELFFSRDIQAGVVRLDPEESAHCVKVLRHREGDSINIISIFPLLIIPLSMFRI